MIEPEDQHSNHAVSVYSKKNNQRIKVIGHIPDSLIKVVHELISEWKVLQAGTNIDGKHRGAPWVTWVPVGQMEIPCIYLL